jgi:hypothetical protein
MMRRSQVPESHPTPVDDPPSHQSLVDKRVQRSLKFLGAYAVSVVNVAAVLYIVIKVLVAGIRRLTE